MISSGASIEITLKGLLILSFYGSNIIYRWEYFVNF